MRMKPILKRKTEMTWIVLLSKITSRHNIVKQLKIRKKENQVQINHNHNIIFKYSLGDHNNNLILILTGLRINLLQGSLISKDNIP